MRLARALAASLLVCSAHAALAQARADAVLIVNSASPRYAGHLMALSKAHLWLGLTYKFGERNRLSDNLKTAERYALAIEGALKDPNVGMLVVVIVLWAAYLRSVTRSAPAT